MKINCANSSHSSTSSWTHCSSAVRHTHTHSYIIITFSHYVQCQQDLTTACDSPVVSASTPGYVPPSVRSFPGLKIASVELLVETRHLDAVQSQVTVLASRCFLLSLKNVLTHPSAFKDTLFHFRLFGRPGTFCLTTVHHMSQRRLS